MVLVSLSFASFSYFVSWHVQFHTASLAYSGCQHLRLGHERRGCHSSNHLLRPHTSLALMSMEQANVPILSME